MCACVYVGVCVRSCKQVGDVDQRGVVVLVSGGVGVLQSRGPVGPKAA